jgi:phenylacetic acid degradation operon negative regulatory protein
VLPDREPAWTATLVRALAQFGVSEKAARQAIARTSGEGWISPLRRGRLVQWQLTDAGGRLLTDGAKRIYSFGAGARAWDGRWLILMVSLPDGGRDRRHQLRARLNWAGFGLLPTGAWVCPDPAREAEAAGILADLGLLETSMSFVATNGTVGAQAGIAALAWDLDAVEIRYKRFIEQFEPLVAGTDEAMLTAQTMLVHEWRRFPFLDPQLPHDLLPPAWLGTQAAALFAARHAAWRDGARQRWQALARAV